MCQNTCFYFPGEKVIQREGKAHAGLNGTSLKKQQGFRSATKSLLFLPTYCFDRHTLICTITGELNSSTRRLKHSSGSGKTSRITKCVWVLVQPHNKKWPCSVSSIVRQTASRPSRLMEQPIKRQCSGIVGSGSSVITHVRSTVRKSFTVKSAEEYLMKSLSPSESGST